MASEAVTPHLSRTTQISVVAAFSALISVSTFISIPAPNPLGEITWAPPIYMMLTVLAGTEVGFVATGIGSFVGESLGVAFKGFPAIYAPGIVWARAPEAIIIGWARKKSRRTLAAAMAGATIFETLGFFFPDWAFSSYGLFQYGPPSGVISGLALASFDLLTLVDFIWIPVTFLLISAARPAFRRLGYL